MTVRMFQLLEGGEGAAGILILFTAALLLLIHRRLRREQAPVL